jgi:hypothetical protein
LVTRGGRQEELSGAIAGRGLVRPEEFNPLNLANTAWTFATLGTPQEKLLRLEEPHPQFLTTTALAFATRDVLQESLRGIAGTALVRFEEFNPRGLANTAWEVATLGVREEELRSGGGLWRGARSSTRKPWRTRRGPSPR